MNKKALTLLEIIVSIILLSVTMIGLTNIFISGKRHILHARARSAGGELGKYFLDPLQAEVREDTWNTTGNNLTAGQYPPRQKRVNNIDYNYTYNITNTSITDNTLRRVIVRIGWNETKP